MNIGELARVDYLQLVQDLALDNDSEKISPEDLRQLLLTLAYSAYFKLDDQVGSGGSGFGNFNPLTAQYLAGSAVAFEITGSLRLWQARVTLRRSSFADGRIPAPTGLATDSYWREISPVTGPNLRPDLWKAVGVYEPTAASDAYEYPALTKLDPETLCLQTQCSVELPERRIYVLVYDARETPALRVWRDATFTGPKIGAKWVELGSAESLKAGFLPFDSSVTMYAAGTNVTYVLYGQDLFFQAREQLNAADFGGAIPAPTGTNADANWRLFTPPIYQHQQNTDRGTTQSRFRLGLDTQSQEGESTYRVVEFYSDSQRKMMALGARWYVDESGVEQVELVQCRNYTVPATEQTNVWEPLGGGVPEELYERLGRTTPVDPAAALSALGYQDGGAFEPNTDQLVKAGWVYTYGGRRWRSLKDMTANAEPIQGPNWALHYNPTPGVGSLQLSQLAQEVVSKLPVVLPNSTVLIVQAAGQTEDGIVGRFDRPFASLQAAHDAAPAGAVILVLPATNNAPYAGPYTNKSLAWFGLGMPRVSAGFLLGHYQGTDPFQMRLNGLHFEGYLGALKQRGGGSYALVENCEFAGAAFLLLQGFGVDDAGVDTVEVRNSRFDTTGAEGCVQFRQRDDFGQMQNLILDNCLLRAAAADCFTGTIHSNSRITLRGPDVRVQPAASYALHSLKRTNGNAVLADDAVLVDERPAATGGGDLSTNQLSQDQVDALAGADPQNLPSAANKFVSSSDVRLVAGKYTAQDVAYRTLDQALAVLGSGAGTVAITKGLTSYQDTGLTLKTGQVLNFNQNYLSLGYAPLVLNYLAQVFNANVSIYGVTTLYAATSYRVDANNKPVPEVDSVTNRRLQGGSFAGRITIERNAFVHLDSVTGGVINLAAADAGPAGYPATLILEGSTSYRELNNAGGVTVVDRRAAAAALVSGGGGIDYVNPVQHTSAATLTAADMNKLHVLSGANFVLTLPAAPAAGDRLRVQVAETGVGLYTIAGNGKTLNGQAQRVLWAGESAEILFDGTAWAKLSGLAKAMSVTMRLDGNGNINYPAGSYAVLPYNTLVTRNCPDAFYNLSANRVNILRPGNYLPLAEALYKFSEPNGDCEVLVLQNDTLNAKSVNKFGVTGAPLNGQYVAQPTAIKPMELVAGDFVLVRHYLDKAGFIDNRTQGYAQLVGSFTLEEKAPW